MNNERSKTGELVKCELVNSEISSPVHYAAGGTAVHKFKKPKSAGNEGFRKHNKKLFMKTERIRGLGKRNELNKPRTRCYLYGS